MGNILIIAQVSNPNTASDIKNGVGNIDVLTTIFDADTMTRMMLMSDMVDELTEDTEYFCTRCFEGFPMFAFAICRGKIANIQEINLCDFFIEGSRWCASVSTTNQNMFELQRV